MNPTATAPPTNLESPSPSSGLFDRWVRARHVPHLGSNAGAEPLPFQSWHRFKEAFPPELVRRLIDEDAGSVSTCIDPFGGSGTTALAAQFLGVSSTTIEINPFLVDVIRSKVASYNADELADALGSVRRRAQILFRDPRETFVNVPQTFIEPGLDGRWIFDHAVASRIASLLAAIDEVSHDAHRRLFRVLVGGLLADVSNVVVSGKGRRYRRNWQERPHDPASVLALFCARGKTAIADIYEYADRPAVRVDVLHGDARSTGPRRAHDIAIFSPPYPNSFDYTDVYNLELWMLGYLADSADNRDLRLSTVTSHVQLHREYKSAPNSSPTLSHTLAELASIKDRLWSPWIPAMVGAYFADLMQVISRVKARLKPSGRCCIVVGDSRYGGVLVATAEILAELATDAGWRVQTIEPVRAMRSSAQQGLTDLSESLLVLTQ